MGLARHFRHIYFNLDKQVYHSHAHTKKLTGTITASRLQTATRGRASSPLAVERSPKKANNRNE